MKPKIIILIGILMLAFALRFYKLDTLPALNADEAAIGYNAWSLIQTGKDEHGNPWPIHFQSFNDYKPGGYFYLVLPFVVLLGLNEWAVRIPAATLGVATVFLVYLLAKKLVQNSGNKNLDYFPLIAALFLAISPWHIHFSRGGWEVGVATFFMVLGVWAFLKAQEKSWWYVVSLSAFVASLYTYHAARVVAPVLGLALVLIYHKNIIKKPKIFIIAIVTAFIVALPLAIDFVGPAGASRATGVGLFADSGPLSRINEQRGEHEDYTNILPKFLHNKPVNYGLAFLDNWASHYWGEFLFLSGDEIQRNRVPETGQMYVLDLIFVAFGVVYLIKKPKGFEIIIVWLLIAPLASALTFQSPHALRAQDMVIPLVIISALGLTWILNICKKMLKNRVLLIATYSFFGLIIILGLSRYLHMYYTHMAKEYTFSSQYGVKEMVGYIKDKYEKYDRVIITDRYDQPYILTLFYLKYPPQEFYNNHELTRPDQYGFSTVTAFDNFYFGSVDFDKTKPENPNSLIIGTDEEIPNEANIVKKIYGTNDHLYFEVVEN